MSTGLTEGQIKEMDKGISPKSPQIPLGLMAGFLNQELDVLTDTWTVAAPLAIDLSAPGALLCKKAVVGAGVAAEYDVNFTLPRKNCHFALIVDADTNNINQTLDINAVDADGTAVNVKHPGGAFTSPNNNTNMYIFWWNGTDVICFPPLVGLATV